MVACSKLGSCRRPTDPSDPEMVQKQELQKRLWIKGTVQSDVVVCSGGRHAAQEVKGLAGNRKVASSNPGSS